MFWRVPIKRPVIGVLTILLPISSLFIALSPSRTIAQAGLLPDRCASKSDLIVKFKSVSIKNSPTNGKLGVSFNVTVTHPPVDDRNGRTLVMAFYEKEGSNNWVAIASSSQAISAPYTISPRVIDNGTTSQVTGFVRIFNQEPSTASFNYAVYTYFGDNLNPNCSGPHSVTLSYKGDDENKTIPPCPVNVHPIKTADLGETNVEFQQVMLAWDFTWSNQPSDANIVYKYSIATESNSSGFLRPDEFTEKQALIQLLDTKGGKNTITIFSLNKTSNKLSLNCKPVVFQNTEAGGPYIWIDQDGNSHSVSAGEFANVTNDSDQGCGLGWIISGGSLSTLLLNNTGPSKIISQLNINENDLNPFSRLTICIYVWMVDPVIRWASGLIEDVGGIATIIHPPKEYLDRRYA